jgi:glycosyltransferase involved in cell wall biosynthesis
VVTVSESFREVLVQRGVRRDRIEVVHNAIAPDWGLPHRDPREAGLLRSELRIAPEHNVILIVGRLSREKDHLSLLRAVHDLPVEMNPRLIIVGEGPERSRIEREILALGMGDFVTLTGQQDSIERYYGIAKIVVLSSLSEGSPNTLLEAMVAGIPVVSTRVGGVPEIVTHGESAYLVPPRDVQGLRDALVAVLAPGSELPERLGRCARVVVQTRHAPADRVLKLLNLYRSLDAHSR